LAFAQTRTPWLGLTKGIKDENMINSKPCTATCVIDGSAVTVTFYPDTCDLRISDAYGACIQKARWLDSWTALLAALRDISRLPDEGVHQASALVANLGVANTNHTATGLAAAA
jgi:hypothetical protein